jgi:ribonuclease-3 family protein
LKNVKNSKKGDIMVELINREKSEMEVNMLSPLTWAYVGDAIYELYIRTNLVNNTKLKPHKLHIESIKYVKAKAQAEILKKIENELSEDEKDIVRRGRNAENHHIPKNAEPADYMYSTAFEGLIGYLYLTKQDERLKEILKMCM